MATCFSSSFQHFLTLKEDPAQSSQSFLNHLDSIKRSLSDNDSNLIHSKPTSDPLNRRTLLRDEYSSNLTKMSDILQQYTTSASGITEIHRLNTEINPVIDTPRAIAERVAATSCHDNGAISRALQPTATFKEVISDDSFSMCSSDEEQNIEINLDESGSKGDDVIVSRDQSIYSEPSNDSDFDEFDDVRSRLSFLPSKSLTSPRPFSFTNRKREQKLSRTLQEYIDQKEEEKVKKHVFKANPVPRSTSRPKFNRLLQEQARRSNEIKQKSLEVTKSKEAPFSFYSRDKSKASSSSSLTYSLYPSIDCIPPPRPKFTANPVPESSRTALYSEVVAKQEKKREERVRARSAELMSSSKLPPRMELWETMKKEAPKRVYHNPELKFKPKISKIIPDYETLQLEFRDALDKRKSQFKPTVPCEFPIQPYKSKEEIVEKVVKDMEEDERKLRENRWPYLSKREKVNPTPIPSFSKSIDWERQSNITYRARKNKTNQLFIKREEEKQRKMIEDQKRKEANLEITKKVASKLTDTVQQRKTELEEKLANHRKQVKTDTLKYKKTIKEIKQKVSERPFLFELNYGSSDDKSTTGKSSRHFKVAQSPSVSDDEVDLSAFEPSIIIEGNSLS
ncbi:hypothetical protein RCL1_008471 [Eukaryota sp. TZLM3-RCL]